MPNPESPPMTRAVVLRGAGFAFAIALGAVAVWLIVTSTTQKRLEIGVLAGLWGLLLGAISMFGVRRPAHEPESSRPAATEVAVREPVGLERADDAAARREWQTQLEQMLRREINATMNREVSALRSEIAQLRQDLLEKVGGQLRLERIETTRLIGSDLEALQDEVRQLKNANEGGSVAELITRATDSRVTAVRQVVEPARANPVSTGPLVERAPQVLQRPEFAQRPDAPQRGEQATAPPSWEAPAQRPPAQRPPAQTQTPQTPPTQRPPTQTPPAQTPPTQTPPAQRPPTQTPPAQRPPAQTQTPQRPPAQTQTPQRPPAQRPPAQTPPAQRPPSQRPPSQRPPSQPAATGRESAATTTDPTGTLRPTPPRAADPTPAAAGQPAPATSEDPFASLPRIRPFTEFALDPLDEPAPAPAPAPTERGAEPDAYTGRRRLRDDAEDDRPAVADGQPHHSHAAPSEPGRRHRRAEELDDNEDLLARLLAREGAEH